MTPRIVMPNASTAGGARPTGAITIGGRTVTLQLAPGQKKVTLVNAQQSVQGTPKIIMMPATSTNAASVQQQQQQQQQQQNLQQTEQLDGAFDIEQLDGIDDQDDIESQISTVKIEKHCDGDGDVKVTTSSANADKMEENEAAAILSTIGEVSQLSSHSVNTHVPMHDEK
jgi:hypothetical protein